MYAPAASLEKQLEATERLLTDAETKRVAKNNKEAIRLYGATIKAYEEIARRFPDEESALIQFRLNYCRNELMRLIKPTQAPQPGPEQEEEQTEAQLVPEPLRRATVHCRMGQFEQALGITESFVSTSPEHPYGHLLLATAKLGLGKHSEAEACLAKALELDPTLADAHYNLAQLLLRKLEPDFAGARTHYMRAIELGAAPDENMEVVLAPAAEM